MKGALTLRIGHQGGRTRECPSSIEAGRSGRGSDEGCRGGEERGEHGDLHC